MAIKPTDSQLVDCACVILADPSRDKPPTMERCHDAVRNLRYAFPMSGDRFAMILGKVLQRQGLIDG